MSDEITKPDSLVVFNSPDDVPVTPDNAKYVGARRPGRPKGPDRVSDALKKKLAEGAATKIANGLIKVAVNENGKYTNAQVAAAREVLDRTEGRAVQPIAVANMDMDAATAERLVEIGAMLQRLGFAK